MLRPDRFSSQDLSGLVEEGFCDAGGLSDYWAIEWRIDHETLSDFWGVAMSTIAWLHLSDLHLRGTETSVDRGTFNDMLLDIEKRREEEGLDLDAVFFTGDVVFSGQIEQYNSAAEWFDRILEACGLSGQRDRCFIVPGNHDVDRKAIYPDKKKL